MARGSSQNRRLMVGGSDRWCRTPFIEVRSMGRKAVERRWCMGVRSDAAAGGQRGANVAGEDAVIGRAWR
jgi:hypothetical protein